ncbi:BREX-1 system adenine-specific DNA-methyltransferase PglX [Rhizobium sp. SU303]|uniref:BREX-1 system adenine-specific DNA-methyltransferase PglX n=1 Tax=Rhizobium sp. SU303 TaxID=3138065 RepID=UPI001E63F4EA|nr:BREX-1 system adenine-specific DNA-methyltransferase PglX [Rhizobium leguminosarum]UFW79632.1 BREX-1 system adenine-specific DNA-methyltransferase PglX [Rhizobium leguminosarum bv. viciae]
MSTPIWRLSATSWKLLCSPTPVSKFSESRHAMTINRTALKNYAPQARLDFIQAMTNRAAQFGITKSGVSKGELQGELFIVEGKSFSRAVGNQREKLVERINQTSFEQVIEAVAYTWFNRFLAIRYMELHGYFDHGYRVLSHPQGHKEPEILEEALHLDLPGLKRDLIVEMKLMGTQDEALYRKILIAQCNDLYRAMPFLFEKIEDETELLLPENLLQSDSIIRKLVGAIDEAEWNDIEIIGWLYQFYISHKKDQVIGKVVKSEDIPAATQLFTPNWIVKYMVQNSLGATWLGSYPDSAIKGTMDYYVDPAKQTWEVSEQLAAITPRSLDPEALTLIDPAVGSGHILVEAYDLFKAIYIERGYTAKEAARLILTKNLYGLDIDDRAAQMAGFALLMKARADDSSLLRDPPMLNVLALQESNGLNADVIIDNLKTQVRIELVPPSDLLPETLSQPILATTPDTCSPREAIQGIRALLKAFRDAKTYGSLITLPHEVVESLPFIEDLFQEPAPSDLLRRKPYQAAIELLRVFVHQAKVLGRLYDCVVANPPYMGAGAMNPKLKAFCTKEFPSHKLDTYSSFVANSKNKTKEGGIYSLIVMHSWMFVFKYESMRKDILDNNTILNLSHIGTRGFPEITGEVVQAVALSVRNNSCRRFLGKYIDLTPYSGENKGVALRNRSAREYQKSAEEFSLLPSAILCYWATDRELELFRREPAISSVAEARHGMVTSDNDRFLRWWWEVSTEKIRTGCDTRALAAASGGKWFPYNKGGSYRKWYGNIGLVVNWEHDGAEIFKLATDLYGSPSRKLPSQEFYFAQGLTWSALSSDNVSFRFNGPGYLFDSKGSSLFLSDFDESKMLYLMAFLNSRSAARLLNLLCPTLDYNAGSIAKLPLPPVSPNLKADIVGAAREIREMAKEDWDFSEISWDFQHLRLDSRNASNWSVALSQCRESARSRMLDEINKCENIFQSALRLDDDILPTEDVRDLGFQDTNPAENFKSLVSFAVGCIMGRYSLSEPGLIYAKGSNVGFESPRYGAFPADVDGIIPTTEEGWFEDDAANRFEEFLSVVWPGSSVSENLAFLIDGLVKGRADDPRADLRSYFSKRFYSDHLQTYKNRPIYWMFSSGKQKAFECLVYLHRYNEGTLARMRTEYVTPLMGKMQARIEALESEITQSSSSAEKNRKNKDVTKFRKQLEELRAFDEELRHLADQRIALDLDDGVKVNYGKFGNLLAATDKVCGKRDDAD